mgnify:CR=1 FL=1
MKRFSLCALLLGLAAWSMTAPAAAASLFGGGCTDSCSVIGCDGGCASACGCGSSSCSGGCWLDEICDSTCADGGFFASAELLLLKYHRADGVRAGSFSNFPPASTDDIEFDYAASPRLTVGYVADCGLGVRLRYWEYDQAGDPVFPATGVAMDVDTYNFDLEMFDRFVFSDCWSCELSGGIRYNEFTETMIDPIPPAVRINQFDGLGGLVGLEVQRSLGRFGNLYGRTRLAIMQDDRFVSNITGGTTSQAVLRDATLTMTEIAFGYEYAYAFDGGALAFFRAGYEWQHWDNFSSSFSPFTTATGGGNPPAQFAGPSDVGFGGFSIMLGFEL